MSDRPPDELAAMSADAQGASDGAPKPADGGAGDEPVAAAVPSEAPQASEPTPVAESTPVKPAQENPRGARRRKRKADRGRRVTALGEAPRSAPAGEDEREERPVVAEPAGASAEGGAGGDEDRPMEHGEEETATAAGAADAVETSPDEAAAADTDGEEESHVDAAARGMGEAAEAIQGDLAREGTETTADAVEAGPSDVGEVMPFSEDAMDGDIEAVGVEELDIDDAEEVTAVAEEGKPLLPSPLPEAPADWHERVFDDDYLRVLPPPDADQFERELRFCIDSLGVSRGSRILDLGCGSGLHSVELQARGFDVVGLDSSMPLLMRATEEAQRRGLGPSFVHGDMRALSLENEFDGVLCIHGTFGYFDDQSNFGVISTIYRALRSGGRFLLGVPNRDYFVGDLPARVCWEAEGCMVLDEVDFDFLRGRLEVKRAIAIEDGRQIEHRYSIRTYALHELSHLVEQAGFRVVSVSGHVATRDTFLGPYSRSILLVAQKP